MPSLDLDPGEITVLLRGLPPRQELVYRLAIRGLSARCRGDRQFRQRTDALIEQYRKDLPAVLKEAGKLGAELTISVRTIRKHRQVMPRLVPIPIAQRSAELPELSLAGEFFEDDRANEPGGGETTILGGN